MMLTGEMLWFLSYAAASLVVFTTFSVMVYRKLYVSVGPDELLVISGGPGEMMTDSSGNRVRRGYRLVRGGGTLINPILEKYGVLSLGIINMEMREAKAPLGDGRCARIEAVANVRLRSDEASLPAALGNFLSKTREEVAAIVGKTVAAELRAALASLTAGELTGDRNGLTTRLGTHVAQALDRLSMDLVTLAVADAGVVE